MNFFKNNPAFKILIPLVLGIVLSVMLAFKGDCFLWISCVLIIPSLVFIFNKSYKNRFLIGLVYSSLIFCLGVQLVIVKTQINYSNHFAHHINESSILEVKLTENLLLKANSYKAVLQVNTVINDSVSIPVRGNLLAYFSKDSKIAKLKYGDVILLKARINEVSKPTNPEQFNYKYYLTLNNINHQVFIKAKNYISLNNNKENVLISFGNSLRNKLYSYLELNGVEGDQLKVASALLLGYREFLDKDLVKSYSSAGAMHVLAVSGLHVGIIFFLLKFSFGFLVRLKRGKFYFTFIILFCLWFYAMMTGFSPSVLRATTMFSLILIGEKLINRKVSIYNTLAVSAVILLVFNPFLVFEVGFQLSYLAVIGIVYIQPKIYNLWYMPNLMLDKAWQITSVSLAAQVATFPLGLYYFHQFPVYFFVSNLVVIPAAILIFYLGVFLFVISPFGGFSVLIGKMLNGIIGGLNWSVKFTEELTYSLIKEISITRLDTYLLYIIIVSFLYALHKRNLKVLYICFTVCFVFIGIQLYERVININQKEFTVYSVNKSTAFEFSVGNKAYFIGNLKLLNDESKMLFNIKHNWFKKNITDRIFINKNNINHKDEHILFVDGIISFDDLKLIYLNANNVNLVDSIKPSYLIVSKENEKLLYKIRANILKDVILILDSSISSHKLNYWNKKFVFNRVISTSNAYYSFLLN